MNEFLGLGYFAEVPTVLIDVQRTGPSTGMPTRTQQSDILLAAYASHGDTKHPLLFPASPKECFEMTADAFDLTEQLQTPVIVMTDLDLGMNDHVTEPLVWDDSREYNRGKVLTTEQLDRISRGTLMPERGPPAFRAAMAMERRTLCRQMAKSIRTYPAMTGATRPPANRSNSFAANSAAISTSTTTAFRTARSPARIRPTVHSSPAAHRVTNTPSIPRTATPIAATSIASRENGTRRRNSFRSRSFMQERGNRP